VATHVGLVAEKKEKEEGELERIVLFALAQTS
jgi:hypothetical protein